MKHNPWFKFDPAAWLSDVELRSCTSAERGTLIDLMCIAHTSTPYGHFMADDSPESCKMVAKCLSLSSRTFVNHLSSLLHMTRICKSSDGSLYVKRMVQDHDYALRQSGFGAKGGNPTLKAPLKPEKSKRREEKNKKGGYPAAFEQFWKAYPKKRQKGDALKAWLVIKDMPTVSEIVRAIKEQSKRDDWTKDKGQYIPYPATWIRARQWEDGPEEAKVKNDELFEI